MKNLLIFYQYGITTNIEISHVIYSVSIHNLQIIQIDVYNDKTITILKTGYNFFNNIQCKKKRDERYQRDR